jgi:uncharacterized protein YoxC
MPNTLVTISVTVIAAIMVVAVIVLIPVLLQIRRTAREIEKLTDMVRTQVAPVTRDLTNISRETKNILQSIRRQVDKVEDGVSVVRDVAIRVHDFEREIQQRVEEPLLELAALTSGLCRGLSAFTRIFRR